MKYQIRNWKKFQHYKDRNPPWIKLHESVLASADWVMLDNDGRVLAIACMLVAAKNDNQIDTSEAGRAYMQRVAYLPSLPDFKPLIQCGFLVACEPEMQADASTCKQMLADARPEERRAETEQSKTKKKNNATTTVSKPDDIEQQIWQDFLDLRRQKKAKLTITAWDRIRKELDKGKAQGYTPNDMMAEAIASGWQAFKLDWYLNRVQKAQPETKRARTELL